MQAELFEAIRAGDADAVRAAVAGDAALAAARDDKGMSAVMTALYHRQPAVVEILLEQDPALDAFERSALGRLESAPDDPNARAPDGFTALHLACFFGHADAARLLLEHGADAEAVAPIGNVRPLHSAAAARAVEVVRVLVEHGVDVNARQLGGYTALDAAKVHGLEEMAALLREHGAA